MEKQFEQHAPILSERTATREKSGFGTSPSLNAYFSYRIYELDKGEYVELGTQLNNQASQLRNLEVKMGQMANILIER